MTPGKVLAIVKQALRDFVFERVGVSEALIVGAATTSGVRLDLESGSLAVREGDDSAYAAANARTYRCYMGTSFRSFLAADLSSGADGVCGLNSTGYLAWYSVSPISGSPDTGLARDSAGQVKVTDGSTGVGNLRATALIVGTADTSGVRLDLESGTLAVREGDDSAYAPLVSGTIDAPIVRTTASGSATAGVFQIARDGNTVHQFLSANNGLGISGFVSSGASTAVNQVAASSGALSGASYSFSNALPAGAIILGVTVRVTTTITGATSFDVGDGTDVDRYGAAVALASGTTTTFASATANPLEWRSADGNVVLTANGSNFTGGVVRICVHYLTGTAPTS